MWRRVEDRLALLELLTRERLPRRRAQADAYRWLADLSWTRATDRRDEIALVPDARPELEALLDRAWPRWRDAHRELVAAGLPPTPRGWRKLADHRRLGALPALPSRLNRHTAAALTAPGAKSRLTDDRRAALGDREIVEDGVLRLRPPPGLTATRGDRRVDLDAVVAVLDEVGISDRALRDGLALHGSIDAVLTVENLGAWRDMPRPDRWMLVYVPGWNTATVHRLADALPGVPFLHFGDLDPNGVRIARHLRAAIPGMDWFVPDFWHELATDHARTRAWPDDLDVTDAPELVRHLAARGLWLEQERIALDPRLPDALEAALRDRATRT